MTAATTTLSACVIFDTRYGNTEKIARSFGTGLQAAGVQTTCANVKDVRVESLEEYDLIAVGAPTQYSTAPETMKEFLEKLRSANLARKYGFAFDTRRDHFLAGSAAKYIERKLKNIGLKIIAPRSSAIIFTKTKEEVSDKEARRASARLKEGEEKRFEQVGLQVGAALAARSSIRS